MFQLYTEYIQFQDCTRLIKIFPTQNQPLMKKIKILSHFSLLFQKKIVTLHPLIKVAFCYRFVFERVKNFKKEFIRIIVWTLAEVRAGKIVNSGKFSLPQRRMMLSSLFYFLKNVIGKEKNSIFATHK
jgi:hypothetical protein